MISVLKLHALSISYTFDRSFKERNAGKTWLYTYKKCVEGSLDISL